MDQIITILAIIVFAYITFTITTLLSKISKHLRAIRLQLEIQNPIVTTEQLLELDKNIEFWHDQMFKYKDKSDDRFKEIGDLTFKLFLAYVDKLHHYRIQIVEINKTGDQDKIDEKYEKWFHENDEKIEEMEKKAMVIDSKIKDVIDKRNLDQEFLGKWDIDES